MHQIDVNADYQEHSGTKQDGEEMNATQSAIRFGDYLDKPTMAELTRLTGKPEDAFEVFRAYQASLRKTADTGYILTDAELPYPRHTIRAAIVVVYIAADGATADICRLAACLIEDTFPGKQWEELALQAMAAEPQELRGIAAKIAALPKDDGRQRASDLLLLLQQIEREYRPDRHPTRNTTPADSPEPTPAPPQQPNLDAIRMWVAIALIALVLMFVIGKASH